MAIIAKETRKEWTQAPEGLWPAVCVDVVELGLVETAWGKKEKVRLVWQIEGNAGYVFRAQRIISLYRPGIGSAR